MGPLFSIAAGIIIAAIIASAIFVVMVFFLPWRLALRIAGGAAIGSAIGFVGTLFAEAPFYPSTLSSRPQVLSFLGSAVVGGLAGALICTLMIFRMWQRKL